MFEYMIGELISLKDEYIVLECNGIGYAIYTSNGTMRKIGTVGSRVRIHTHMNVKEDALTLYGFVEERELAMFRLLQTVSKIGPKVAIGILSSIDYYDLNKALALGDDTTLSKAPGIGKKTAQRMILELKDKVSLDGVEMDEIEEQELLESKATDSMENEALEALMSLGYSKAEVISIISSNTTSGMKTEDIIKLVLKEIGR